MSEEINARRFFTDDCRRGDLEAVRDWIRRDPSLVSPTDRQQEEYGFSLPLFSAAESGSLECVQLLLDAGADVSETPQSEESVLCFATTPEIAGLLIAHGAKVDSHDWYEDVLGRVFERANEEAEAGDPSVFAVADVLLDAGASLDFNHENRATRLYLAAFRHQAHVVEFLLERGASRAADDRGATALHAICWQGEYEAEETNAACERIIRTLVGAGFSLEARDDEGRTPLHKATGGDWANDTATRTLLAFGANPNVIDSYEQSPLHLAARDTAEECIVALLQAGADASLRDQKRKRPIDLAREHSKLWREWAASSNPVELPIPVSFDLGEVARNGGLTKAEASVQLLQDAMARMKSNCR